MLMLKVVIFYVPQVHLLHILMSWPFLFFVSDFKFDLSQKISSPILFHYRPESTHS